MNHQVVKCLLYPWSIKLLDDGDSAYVSLQDVSVLWHKRLGHTKYRSLVQLKKQNLVENLPPIKEKGDVCEVCQYGKQTRLSFLVDQAWRAKEKLHLVHFDVWGP